MKKIFTPFLFCLLTFFSFAQQAPDFTINATDGNTHTLYADYLDQGYTVVIDFMYTTCPPCIGMAPYMESTYEAWGSGNGDVEFFAISPSDVNSQLIAFENTYNLSYHGAGTNGGSTAVLAPYLANQFGTFYGYPTIVVISPDGSVNFDVWGSSYPNTASLLNAAITDSGATGSSPLSVEMSSFTGDVLLNGIELEWITRSEYSNEGFQIMRSSDGRNFEKIGHQAGAGITSTERHYTFLDEAPGYGVNYYQLVSMGTNGFKHYSNMIEATWQKRTKLSISPNPINGQALQFSISGLEVNTSYQIVDQLGQIVRAGMIDGTTSNFNISCNNLQSGVYFLNIGEGDAIQSKRFVVK